MVDELKDTLSLIQTKRPPAVRKKPQLEIDVNSTPAQVQSWIKERGFNERYYCTHQIREVSDARIRCFLTVCGNF